MRKLTFVSVVLVALVATSIAVAHGIEGAKGAKKVSGTFTATSATVSTRTCTTQDGKSLSITDGKYTGTATGDADLTGAITLRARSVINTTDKVGTVDGALKIDAAGKDTRAAYSAVYDGGSLAGYLGGKAHASNARLLGNLSASFDPATGFTNGKVGGTTGGSAVEVGPGSCKATGDARENSEARGTISAVSSTSITVAGLTCDVPSDKANDVAKFKQGDAARIRCRLANGANTLVSIDGKSKH